MENAAKTGESVQAILIEAGDTVATVTADAAPGAAVEAVLGGTRLSLTALDPIPRWHKIAVRDMAAGEAVVKYGQPIGHALRDIRAGEHVHTHNLA